MGSAMSEAWKCVNTGGRTARKASAGKGLFVREGCPIGVCQAA